MYQFYMELMSFEFLIISVLTISGMTINGMWGFKRGYQKALLEIRQGQVEGYTCNKEENQSQPKHILELLSHHEKYY